MSEGKKDKSRRTRGTGGVFKPKGSRFWWVKYLSGGKMHYESSGSERGPSGISVGSRVGKCHDRAAASRASRGASGAPGPHVALAT